ncbi:MAG: DUF6282 family protein [Trebonia sp.]
MSGERASETTGCPPGPTLLSSALPAEFSRLIDGAFDVHVHGQPDLSAAIPNRGTDLGSIHLASAYGITGWVLKSHLWATTDRARLLQEQARDLGFTVFGSITLNPPAGGLSATVVELAAAHGAKVVFLPTWGSAADIARDGYISRLLRSISPSFPAYEGSHAISLLDRSGGLSAAATEVIDACHALGLSVATGHASLAESIAVAGYCAQIGQRLLITHPLHYVQEPAELRAFAAPGTFVEFCNGPLLHPDSRMSIRDVHEAIEAVGPDRVVLTTDAFSRWAPPEAECLRIFAEQLSYLGWRADDLRQMLAVNPRQFLGIEAGSSP